VRVRVRVEDGETRLRRRRSGDVDGISEIVNRWCAGSKSTSRDHGGRVGRCLIRSTVGVRFGEFGCEGSDLCGFENR